jgi:hypothetical protein
MAEAAVREFVAKQEHTDDDTICRHAMIGISALRRNLDHNQYHSQWCKPFGLFILCKLRFVIIDDKANYELGAHCVVLESMRRLDRADTQAYDFH